MAKLSQVRLSSMHNILKLMYTDKVEVYRTQRVLNEDGTDGNSKYEKISDYPCKISFGENDDSTHETPVVIEGFLPIKVILDRHIDIKKGDKLVAYRNDENGELTNYSGIANKTAMFQGHQELSFVDRSDA